MNILRTFNGVDYDIELTPEEIQKAFKEQQHLYDIDVVKMQLQYYEEYSDEFYETYGTSYICLIDKIDTIAYEMRRNINEHESSLHYALIDAIESAVKECRAIS